MQTRFAVLLLFASAAGQAPAPGPAGPSHYHTNPGCWEMCKHAKGLGASSCMTDCRTHTDSHWDDEEAVKQFVEDKSYNEAGGEAMERAYEEKYGEKVLSCRPKFDGKPSFDDLDEDGDGVLTASEMIDFGAKMCVSDEMAMQLFTMADSNRNKVIDPKEWATVGEETRTEQAIDAAVDEAQGAMSEDVYNEVKTPHFEEFDHNGDGVLSDEELEDVLMHEFYRRFPDATEEQVHSMAGDVVQDLAEIVDRMDQNGDGKISKAEFEAKGKQVDLGHELEEAAYGDKNGQDPDNLHRVEHPTAAPLPPDYLPEAPGPAASPAPALFFVRFRKPASDYARFRTPSSQIRRGRWDFQGRVRKHGSSSHGRTRRLRGHRF